MADLTKEIVEGPMPVGGHMDPFQGDCHVTTWPSEVNIGQLQDEVVEALPGVQVAVQAPRDAAGEEVEVSPEAPLTVFVHPSSADLAAVRARLAAHRPDPFAGMSAEERMRVQLMDRVRMAPEDLSLDEMKEALRILAMG